MIEVHYSARLDPPERDYRYRCAVMLGRSERPAYYDFHCVKCRMKVCELMNQEIIAITDVMDMSNVESTGIGVRCQGRSVGEGHCKMWYYFSLGRA